jgi:biotin carboxyl carrier protein
MAEVIRRTHPASGDGRPGDGGGTDHEAVTTLGAADPPSGGSGRPEVGSSGPVDPRAVRIGLAPASRLADEPPLVAAPPAEPLAPIRDSLAGIGPLGGIARDPATAPPAAADEQPVTSDAPADGPTLLVDGVAVVARLVRRSPDRARLVVGEGSEPDRHRIVFDGGASVGIDGLARRDVIVDGWRFEVEIEPERRAALRERARQGREVTARGGPTEVRAIIPGRVTSVSVAPGDPVSAGQQILVVDAMKMQNELRAPRDGTVQRLGVAPGATIEVGDLLLVIE